MKYRQHKRLLVLVLTIAMLVSLTPAIQISAEDPPGDPVGSNFSPHEAFTGHTVGVYCQEDMSPRQNYYSRAVNLGYTSDSPLEWMLLAFSLENNQKVKLELWTVDEGYKGQNPVALSPDFADPNAPEDFLGERLPYHRQCRRGR